MISRLVENMHQWFQGWALRLAVRREKSSEISLRDCWNDINSCLIIWPGDGLDVTAGEIILDKLRTRFPEAKLTIMPLPGIGASPPSDITVRILKVRKDVFNIFGLPIKELKEKLVRVKADLAIDLSREYNPLAAYLCKVSQARITVAFADPRCDLAFNFQIAPQPGRQVMDRYRVLARYIG